jgi:hypothetical protein
VWLAFWCLQIAAIVYYWIGTWLIDSYVNNFVICIVLLALDFWTVSSLGTGREGIDRKLHERALSRL